jgi:hypothetical protein
VPATYAFSGTAGPGGGTIVYDFFKYYSNGGFYIIVTDVSQFQSRVLLSRLSSVWNQNPIQSDDFATISVRVHSRALQNISALASGYVRDWDGAAWDNMMTTSNPAPHFYDVLTGYLGASPLPAAIVDSDEIVDWRAACIALDYTCNAIMEGKSYADALKIIASCGYAQLRHNETWGVMRDYDRSAETPVQVFTPLNMNAFSFAKAFADQPSGIMASFVNADIDYVTDAVPVYDDPDNPDGSNLEAITYEGLVEEADVAQHAAYDLLQAKLRMTFWTGQTDWESLVCARGSLVGVEHDMLSARSGAARISEVTIVGGMVTGLVLQGTVPVAGEDAWWNPSAAWSNYASAWFAARTGIAIRLKGGAGVLTKEISGASDYDSVVTFATPFADPGASLDTDCVCAIGPLGTEYKRMIVFAVAPDEQLGAKVTFVDEAPELFA